MTVTSQESEPFGKIIDPAHFHGTVYQAVEKQYARTILQTRLIKLLGLITNLSYWYIL